MAHLVMHLDQLHLLGVDAFTQALRTHWGDDVVTVRDEVLDGRRARWALIARPGARAFHLRLAPDETAVTLDGTDDQAGEVGAWVRGLLPADAPRLVLLEESLAWYADIEAGATAHEVLGRRVHQGDPAVDL